MKENLQLPTREQLENIVAHFQKTEGNAAWGFIMIWLLWRAGEHQSVGDQNKSYVVEMFVFGVIKDEERFDVVLTTGVLVGQLAEDNIFGTEYLHVDAIYKLVY